MPPAPPYRFQWWIPFCTFLAFFFIGMEVRFPFIGSDYFTAFQQLLEGRWHFAHYGLAPLQYAVHLCGGMPMYGNPHDIFYSLLQMLALVLDPWRAVEITVIGFLALGYWGWFRFSSDVLRLNDAWAHLLSLIIIAHGFFFMHVLAGHANFFPFPMLGWMLWLLFSTQPRWMDDVLRTIFFALLTTMILYSAGHQVIVFFVLILAAGSPLLLIFRKDLALPSLKHWLLRGCFFSVVTLLLAGSKLVAVHALMERFSRTAGYLPAAEGNSILLYMLRALWAIPQSSNLYQGMPWTLHENSMFLSPVVALAALYALWLLLSSVGPGTGRRIATLVYGALLFSLCLGLLSGLGLTTYVIEHLPVLSSLRVAQRFLYPMSLLLAIGSICTMAMSARTISKHYEHVLIYVAAGITVMGFAVAHLTAIPEMIMTLDYAKQRARFDVLEQRDFTHLPVTTTIVGDSNFLGTTGILCSGDALFAWAGFPQKQSLHEGPVSDVRNGGFNIMQPSCYAYSAHNHCVSGFVIPSNRPNDLKSFTEGKPLPWNVSPLQQFADRESVLVLVLCIAWLCWRGGDALLTRKSSRRIRGM